MVHNAKYNLLSSAISQCDIASMRLQQSLDALRGLDRTLAAQLDIQRAQDALVCASHRLTCLKNA